MNEDIRKLVTRTSVVAGSLAVVLSPVPLADEIVFVPVLGIMAARIGRGHGLPLRDVPWRPIAKTTLAALTARATLNLAVSYIPGVAAAANAVSAVTLTHLLGDYVDGACASPAEARPLSLREIGARLKEAIARRGAPAPDPVPEPAPNPA
jgi:uncharacterized protein (DUF697 family)